MPSKPAAFSGPSRCVSAAPKLADQMNMLTLSFIGASGILSGTSGRRQWKMEGRRKKKEGEEGSRKDEGPRTKAKKERQQRTPTKNANKERQDGRPRRKAPTEEMRPFQNVAVATMTLARDEREAGVIAHAI